MTEKRFKYLFNRLGMQFICYNDKEVLLGTFADKDGVKHITDLLNKLNDEVMDLRAENTRFKLIVSDIVDDLEKQAKSEKPIIISRKYVDWIKKELDLRLYSDKGDFE